MPRVSPMGLTTPLEIELSTALREMVEVYTDEETGGVPMSYCDQPSCIQRAMYALALVDGWDAVNALGRK